MGQYFIWKACEKISVYLHTSMLCYDDSYHLDGANRTMIEMIFLLSAPAFLFSAQ